MVSCSGALAPRAALAAAAGSSRTPGRLRAPLLSSSRCAASRSWFDNGGDDIFSNCFAHIDVHRRREQHRRGTHHNGQVPATRPLLPAPLACLSHCTTRLPPSLHARPVRCHVLDVTATTGLPTLRHQAQQRSIRRLWHHARRMPPHPRCHRHAPPHTLSSPPPPHMAASGPHHVQCRHTLAAIALITRTDLRAGGPGHRRVTGMELHT